MREDEIHSECERMKRKEQEPTWPVALLLMATVGVTWLGWVWLIHGQG